MPTPARCGGLSSGPAPSNVGRAPGHAAFAMSLFEGSPMRRSPSRRRDWRRSAASTCGANLLQHTDDQLAAELRQVQRHHAVRCAGRLGLQVLLGHGAVASPGRAGAGRRSVAGGGYPRPHARDALVAGCGAREQGVRVGEGPRPQQRGDV